MAFLTEEVKYTFNVQDENIYQIIMGIDSFEGRRYIIDHLFNGKSDIDKGSLDTFINYEVTPYKGLSNGYQEISAELKYSELISQAPGWTEYMNLFYLPDIDAYIIINYEVSNEDDTITKGCSFKCLGPMKGDE